MNRTSEQTRSCLRALLADDDGGIRLTLSALLEQKGYEVIAVEDGMSAVEKLTQNEFSIVLLDIQMPGMDGFAACASIRRLENGRNVPILMLTGQDDTDSVKKAFEVGATDFVAKPINYVLMGYRIDYILRAAGVAEELRKSQQRSRRAQRIANLGHVEWNTEREIVHSSKGIREILMLPSHSAFSDFDSFIHYVHPEDRERVESALNRSLFNGEAMNLEHRVLRADGEIRFVLQITESRPRSEVPDRMVVTIQDITERIDIEKRMHALAYYDDLTGLPNRSLLIQHLSQLLKVAVRYEHQTAVIVFGVDRFDKLVEGLDHQATEGLIRMIAERIKNSCRDTDLLSRQVPGDENEAGADSRQLAAKLGNDEYVIVLSAIDSLQSASVFLQRLMELFEQPFSIGDRQVYVSTTAGISLAPIDANAPNQLIKFAAIAKGFASRAGSGSFRYFQQDLNDRVMRKFALADDLRKALDDGVLEVHYQPKVRITDEVLVGVEALCRWEHPVLGPVSPMEFIEIAEQENLIGELGYQVLETACNQLHEWQRSLGCEFGVSVNLSPEQLLDRNAMRRIEDFISGNPLDNQRVEFELTENSLLKNFDTSLNILKRCVEMGCGLAIDDFGTGYSSLSYLGQLPAQTLKIDKSFVHLLESSNQYIAIVGGIIKLAHSLGMSVVAEGVETDVQRTILAREDCDQIQGRLVGSPMSAEDFGAWLRKREALEGEAEYEFNEGGSVSQWRSNYSAR